MTIEEAFAEIEEEGAQEKCSSKLVSLKQWEKEAQNSPKIKDLIVTLMLEGVRGEPPSSCFFTAIVIAFEAGRRYGRTQVIAELEER